MYSKDWVKDTIKETIREIVREIPICREGTGTPTGSEVSFHLDTAHADVTFPTDFGFGPDAYDMDTGIFLPT